MSGSFKFKSSSARARARPASCSFVILNSLVKRRAITGKAGELLNSKISGAGVGTRGLQPPFIK